MAFTSPTFTFTLLIATVCCLMVTAIEEDVYTAEEDLSTTAENRESKQILIAPQFYPAKSQYYYPESSPYGNPYDAPVEGPYVNNYQGARFPSNPFGYSPLDDLSTPSWRHVYTGGRDKVHWWHKNFHREATVNIAPAKAECSVVVDPAAGVASIANDGLGPCKYATQAEQGTITLKFAAKDQGAFIAITANSQWNTRVKLTCTDITTVALFTQTGIIGKVTDTPRTEIGYMQIVAISTDAAGGSVKCNWHSYHHYTGTYP